MAHFPGEILQNIFHCLRNQDLVFCSRVNWLWFEEATRELWSRKVDITSPRTLDSLLSSLRCELNAGYAKSIIFNAYQVDAYFDAGRSLVDDGEYHGDCTYDKLVKVLNQTRSLACRQITLRTIWEEIAQGDSFHNWRRIEKLALSTVGPLTEELVLEEINLPRFVEPRPSPDAHFALSPNRITSLTLIDQKTYNLAIEALKWVPRLETFVWKILPRRRPYPPIDDTIWALLETLNKYQKLKKVDITGVFGNPGSIRVNRGLIRADKVFLVDVDDNVIERVLATFDLTTFQTLEVMPNGSSFVPLNLSVRFDGLTLRHTQGLSALTELTITRYHESTTQCKFGRLNAGTLIALARGNPNLRTLSLGTPLSSKVVFQDVGDRVIDAVAQALPELRHFYVFSKVEGKYMTSQSTISLGKHCRHLRSLSIDPSLDITSKHFMQKVKGLYFCLFPELEWLDMMRCVPKGLPMAKHRQGKLEASSRELENFKEMLGKHFPCLTRLERYDDWRVVGCQWDGEEACDDSLPIGKFMSPYFWRNFDTHRFAIEYC